MQDGSQRAALALSQAPTPVQPKRTFVAGQIIFFQYFGCILLHLKVVLFESSQCREQMF